MYDLLTQIDAERFHVLSAWIWFKDMISENKPVASGKIVAVCISEKKGTQKNVVPEGRLIEDHGLESDAHAGKWHRQVSLLAVEKINEFRARGARVEYGAFGENLVVEGFDLKTLPIGTRFRIGEAMLELTQIGKQCHDHCPIYESVGDCIMPREGVFTRVLKGGTVKPGDIIEQLSPEEL